MGPNLSPSSFQLSLSLLGMSCEYPPVIAYICSISPEPALSPSHLFRDIEEASDAGTLGLSGLEEASSRKMGRFCWDGEEALREISWGLSDRYRSAIHCDVSRYMDAMTPRLDLHTASPTLRLICLTFQALAKVLLVVYARDLTWNSDISVERPYQRLIANCKRQAAVSNGQLRAETSSILSRAQVPDTHKYFDDFNDTHLNTPFQPIYRTTIMRFTTAFVALAAFAFTSALAAPHLARDDLQEIYRRDDLDLTTFTVRDVVDALIARRDLVHMEKRWPTRGSSGGGHGGSSSGSGGSGSGSGGSGSGGSRSGGGSQFQSNMPIGGEEQPPGYPDPSGQNDARTRRGGGRRGAVSEQGGRTGP
ncbi:hypothetical protein EIP91_004350 [Steccherinum ochraceum]|uniref:Uncharacterized protein n=1 Tax=Steccherinum ochraceum TaxID=92696 RepID=A0A4R0RF31_9APHY|nr:hypothetical protein EIP91_004350 [Steccherinum ochraceum]